MGIVTTITVVLVGAIGTVILTWVSQDAYACLPWIQRVLIKIASRRLPENKREEAIEQWTADILHLPQSEILRTLWALDCIRGALALARKRPHEIRSDSSHSSLAELMSNKSLAASVLGEIPASLRRMVRREGLIFRSANATDAVSTVPSTLSLEDAKRNAISASHYYNESVGHFVSPGFLYDDSEEALIIRMLRDVDLSFFYVTRRLNRNVGRNVLKVIAILTGFVLIFPFAINAVLSVPANADWATALYIATCATFAISLWLVRLCYGNATRNNGQYFSNFVQTYFARLLGQHKTADLAFANVLNDRVSELDEVKADANIWFLNLHWLSARQWFLELYVRNMVFQIARNLWLSYLSVPCYFVLATGIYFGFVAAANAIPTMHIYLLEPAWTSWKVFVPWLFIYAIYWWALTGLLKNFWYEITSKGWLGFQTMDVNGVIERNIGLIVREIVDRRRNPYGQGRP